MRARWSASGTCENAGSVNITAQSFTAQPNHSYAIGIESITIRTSKLAGILSGCSTSTVAEYVSEAGIGPVS